MSLALHNDHNVYILGAGFSREANMPLISDFLVRMRDSHEWLETEGRRTEADAVQEVLNFRLSASAAAYWTQLDLENIEELFSLASSHSSSLTDKIQLAIAATLDHAAHSAQTQKVRLRMENHALIALGEPAKPKVTWLEATSDPKLFHLDAYVHHVGMLLGMIRNGVVAGENTFITFNYDTVLERTLETLGLDYSYALRKDGVEFHPSAKAKPTGDLNILKLHGSVNWARSNASRDLTVFGDYGEVRRAGRIPELIPPTWKKVFEEQLAHVWDQAVAALRSATRVIVIGFSIPPTDTHFKYLLAAGLQQNISLRQISFFNLPGAIEPLKARASLLLRNEYIQNERISFHGLDLGSLANDYRALGEIGRPVWRLGDGGTIQRY